MELIETIKRAIIRRGRELHEKANALRSADMFIAAAMFDAAESEARKSLQIVTEHEAQFAVTGKPDKRPAVVADAPVEWRVADKELHENIVLKVGKMAFFCDFANKGDEYIPLPAGVAIPSGANGLPRWEKLAVDCGLPHCFIVGEDGTTTYVAYKGHRINLDEIFDKLPKQD